MDVKVRVNTEGEEKPHIADSPGIVAEDNLLRAVNHHEYHQLNPI